MKPCDDIKIADFSWIIQGPLVTKLLGALGATVVRIEGIGRTVDGVRMYQPFKDNKPGWNRSGYWNELNTSKKSITIDLKNTEGVNLAKEIVAWSDVVLESYTSGTMAKLGLSYEDLIKIKPDLIMAGATIYGQTGPRAKAPGIGTTIMALSGFVSSVGWPDRDPVGYSVPYTDFMTPLYIASAILAAIDHRNRTGKGQYIDCSQYEAGINFLGSSILDYNANDDNTIVPLGNRSTYASPHGTYLCQGNDRWCSIAVLNDEQWISFCQVIGLPELAKDDRFSTFPARKENENELDEIVENWTKKYTAEEVMETMQSAGIPAGVVQSAEDLMDKDPQLKSRKFLWQLNHPEIGAITNSGVPIQFSKSSVEVKSAPCLGEHNEYVCTKILGMSDMEFTKYLESGAFG